MKTPAARHVVHLLGLLLALLGLLTQPAALAQSTSGAAFCGRPVAAAAALVSAPVVLLGEIHGTQEGPAFLGALVCQAVGATGALAVEGALPGAMPPLVVALEIPSNEQKAIDAFVAGGSELEFEALSAQSLFWVRATHDGRSSQAMVDLLVGIRALHARGAHVRVLAFDKGNSDDRGLERDAVMARNMRAAVQGPQKARLLALMGNVHASKLVGASWDAAYRPAAFLLKDISPVVLMMRHAGGSAWVCHLVTGRMDCSAKPLSGRKAEGATPWTIALNDSTNAASDGIFFVGAIQASLPVIFAR